MANNYLQFIEIFNNASDILNSRSINSIGNKHALSDGNINMYSNFQNYSLYIEKLKLKEVNGFVPVLESSRKTVSRIICFNFSLHL